MERSRTFTCEETGLEYYVREKKPHRVYFQKYSHTRRRFVFRKCNKKKIYLCKHIDENVSEPIYCESNAKFDGLCYKHGDRTCAKGGCTNAPCGNGGFCNTHSPNRCKEEGCDNPSQKEGFCMKHHPNRCEEEGCENAVSGHGFCQKHSPNRCEEEGCDRPVSAHGFCQKHSPNRCEEEGCDNPSNSGGLCTTHSPNNKCKHGKYKHHCYVCSENRDLFCTKCTRQLSLNRRTDITINVCKSCETEGTAYESPQNQWHKKLIKIGENLGFEVEFYDVTIKTEDGRTINMRRLDYKLKSTKELVYYIIIECDESSHNQYSVCSEMLRLQEIHDQLIARFGFKPMVVIRFNPNYKDKEYLETEMKKALKIVLTGTFECKDYRGINLYHKLIGYSKKRKDKYNKEPNSKRIKHEGNENENITYI